MIISLISSKRVGMQAILALLMLATALIPMMINGVVVHVPQDASPLYLLFSGWINSMAEWFKVLVVIFIFVAMVLLLAQMYQHLGMLRGKAFLPIFTGILVLFSFPSSLGIHPTMMAMVFFIPSLSNVLKAISPGNTPIQLFNAGFFLSLASLFWPDLLILFPSLFVALMILSLFRWHLWGATLMGLLIPWVYHSSFMWVFDQSEWVLPVAWWNQYTANLSVFGFLRTTYFGLYDLLMYGLSALLIVVSAVTVYRKLDQTVILNRQIYKVLLWVLAVILMLFVTTGGVLHHQLLLLSFFSVFVITDYLQMVKKRKPLEYLILVMLFVYFANHLSSMT